MKKGPETLMYYQGPIEAPVPDIVPPAHEESSTPVVGEVEAAVVALLRAHAAHEGELIGTYAALVDSCEDNGVRYLLRMLLDDEERHHVQFDSMLDSLEAFGEGRRPRYPLPVVAPVLDPQLVENARQLAELERTDWQQLNELARVMKSSHLPREYELLVELMHHDTAKHIAILRFVSERS